MTTELTEQQKRIVAENPMRDVLKFHQGIRSDIPGYQHPFTFTLPNPANGTNITFAEDSLVGALRKAADQIEANSLVL